MPTTNRKAALESYKLAASEVQRGRTMVICPEGTRGRDYHLRPFKKGPFVLAIASQTLADRYRDRLPLAFLPGLAAAVVLHSAYNYRVLPPVAEMLVLLVVVPLIVLATYDAVRLGRAAKMQFLDPESFFDYLSVLRRFVGL